MKFDNFVPFGRPPSGKVMIQVMTEFVVSNVAIRRPFREYYFRLKIAGLNAPILKILSPTVV